MQEPDANALRLIVPKTTKPQLNAIEKFAPLAERVRGLVKQLDLLCKLVGRVHPLVVALLSELNDANQPPGVSPRFLRVGVDSEPVANAMRLMKLKPV